MSTQNVSATSFRSPLAIQRPSRWTEIEFRKAAPHPRTEALARDLEAEIWRVVDLLPRALAREAAHIVRSYPGPARGFIDLFHRPVWSVLGWLEADRAARAAAVRAHALALFLHLWDDHLCDRQLQTDIVTLHLRSLAWREMEQVLPPDRARPLLATYLEAIHAQRPAESLEAHLERFERQIAIWRIAPRMLSERDDRMAALVDEALTQFCFAWRLIDDVQDLEDDWASGQNNSVRLVMDETSAARWDAVRRMSAASVTEDADQTCWGAAEAVLARARTALARASTAAAAAALPDWAEEITAMQGF
jgi:hypothetical protein